MAIASFNNSKPSRLSWIFGAKPPSSPTFVAKIFGECDWEIKKLYLSKQIRLIKIVVWHHIIEKCDEHNSDNNTIWHSSAWKKNLKKIATKKQFLFNYFLIRKLKRNQKWICICSDKETIFLVCNRLFHFLTIQGVEELIFFVKKSWYLLENFTNPFPLKMIVLFLIDITGKLREYVIVFFSSFRTTPLEISTSFLWKS